MKHTKATQLTALEHIERAGAGFWSRNGSVITINFRMAHGNDPTPWINARNAEIHFGALVIGSAVPDGMSGTVVLKLKSLMSEAV